MKLNERATATEVLSTGWCPLDCNYCYIPKTDLMKDMHDEIVEKLRTGEWMEQLDETFQNLQYIGFWGTEPILVLDELADQVDEMVERFPNLKEISFSTSLCLNPKPISKFINKLNEYNISLKWQISVDGHYTDENRMEGATDKIKDNLKILLENTDDITIKWKPTISIENIESMANDKEEIEKYYQYFDDLEQYGQQFNKKAKFISASRCPTLVVPGKYTSEDGRIFAKYIKNMNEFGHDTSYSSRLKRIIDYADQLEENPRMFTCSGGDSNFGFDDGNIHICHRTFYFDREEYMNSIKQQEKYDNWDVSLLEDGIINEVNQNFIVDQSDFKRFEYVMRGYHDYWKLKVYQTEAMLIEMAKCGQADLIYEKNTTLRNLLSLFLHIAHSCPMENILNTGIVHFMPVSIIRLWANGAFQELLKNMGDKDELYRRK